MDDSSAANTAPPVLPTPKSGDWWTHHNGNLYQVLHVTNTANPNPKYPPDVVHQGAFGNVWSRRLSDWHRSFTLTIPARS